MARPPDPVSELFEAGARRLIERAYDHPGQWVATILADPGPRHVRAFRAEGIDVLGPDDVPGRAAKTRWARGFVRAAYRVFKHRGGTTGLASGRIEPGATTTRPPVSLSVEVGAHKPALGVIPAGRAVRAMINPSVEAARAYMRSQPLSARAYDNKGNPVGARWADPEARDWPQRELTP